MTGPFIPDPDDPALLLSAAYTHPPFPRLDDATLTLLEELRDCLASMIGLPRAYTPDAARLAPDQPAPLPAQPVRRPLIETAPGDHCLAEIGYVLVRIETDPITGLDTAWYWQRAKLDAAQINTDSEPQS